MSTLFKYKIFFLKDRYEILKMKLINGLAYKMKVLAQNGAKNNQWTGPEASKNKPIEVSIIYYPVYIIVLL